MSDFDELVGGDDLRPEEEARLRRVHELLVEAGPPPDLPPALASPAEPQEAEILQFPLLPKRRWAIAAIAAAVLVLLGFGGGYLVGHNKAKPAAFAPEQTVVLHGSGADAVLRLGKRDGAGNWPMEVEVTGLPEQQDPEASYAMWVTHDGKPTVPCGWFRVHGKTTTVHFTVPYTLGNGDSWAITAQPANAHGPGAIVLTA